MDNIIERHSRICRILDQLWPANFNMTGESVCEVGPGDCLASAAFFIMKGAGHVDLVELEPPVVNARQVEVLKVLRSQGLPISFDIVSSGEPLVLNERLVSYYTDHIENYAISNQHKFVFSNHVMEHVEDLESCFRSVFRSLRPGGKMLHIVDLGGHGQFEDPIPPLDFQTYQDWLFEWMYPVNHRNTRRFLEDYRQAVAKAGFEKIDIQQLRTVDKAYVTSIWNQLRPTAKNQSIEDLSVIEFALTAEKPA